VKVELPWPPSSLSGHAKGNWHGKSTETQKHRRWASQAAAGASLDIPAKGDIRLRFTFTPPDKRSDRTNYYIRCKAYVDGIADALGVNDKRFVPEMDFTSFKRPKKPGSVVVEILP